MCPDTRVPTLFFYELGLVALVWAFLMLYWLWLNDSAACRQPIAPSKPPRHKRSNPPKLFAGLTQKPSCALCEHEAAYPHAPPPASPAPMPPTSRRPRRVDTSRHFCPHTGCRYRGWRRLGNLRANGHPSGGPWRQFQCTACQGYFPEHHGTIFYGKQVAVELIVRVLACLAEGLGIRATARVFEVAPNTVLHWLVEAAEQLKAFTSHFLCEVHVQQVQLDELYAVLSAVKDGKMREDEAIRRLSRAPHWVWTAIDPQSKLLLAIAVGPRTRTMAQHCVYQIVQVLAPGCVPLFLTDGFKDYLTALLTHFGHWVQPPRRHATGPAPKPRWLPLPELLYAQVIKTIRRQRLVRVRHRVVFGTHGAVQQVLAACSWQINTAFVERLNLTIRQHVAAIGRRVSTLCKGEDGLRQQLALYHCYYNFCLPHASLRQPLPQPEVTNGTGSARLWRPCTPAMAARLTDHVWSLKEVLLYRVPPWPQPQIR
jgi:IS1 family transposase/transposase-like protein